MNSKLDVITDEKNRSFQLRIEGTQARQVGNEINLQINIGINIYLCSPRHTENIALDA